jgi:hypothetical protein
MLLNRAVGGDWPGTLVVRRDLVAPGYGAGGVLFENLDLVRTVAARGGRPGVAFDLVVTRRPPTAGWFARQRVRQAYDEFARPARLAWQLALVPAAVVGGRRAVVGMALASVALAERGRRRGGTAGFPPTAALWAPAWLAERAACSWLAVAARARGGVRYRGRRVARAATPRGLLRQAGSSVPVGDGAALAQLDEPVVERDGDGVVPHRRGRRGARHDGGEVVPGVVATDADRGDPQVGDCPAEAVERQPEPGRVGPGQADGATGSAVTTTFSA